MVKACAQAMASAAGMKVDTRFIRVTFWFLSPIDRIGLTVEGSKQIFHFCDLVESGLNAKIPLLTGMKGLAKRELGELGSDPIYSPICPWAS